MPTLAMVGSDELHSPPRIVASRYSLVSRQIDVYPANRDAVGNTGMSMIEKQPVGREYVTISVPVAIPVAIPTLFTEIIVVSLLIHNPPGVSSVSLIVSCVHKRLALADIESGSGLTLTVVLTEHEPTV